MSGMIERVARAIYAADMSDDEALFDMMSPSQRDVVLDIARAAIAAMREPTEGMLAGTEAPGAWGAEPRFVVPVGYENGPIYREQCAEIYQAMIDAALEERPDSTTPSRS